MKQHITEKQLRELSNSGQEKLKKWWKPLRNDLAYCPTFKMGVRTKKWSIIELNDAWVKDWRKMVKEFEWVKDSLPLLSIGQMINFIDEDKTYLRWLITVGKAEYMQLMGGGGGYSVIQGNPGEPLVQHVQHADELCDALWKAVRTILEENNI